MRKEMTFERIGGLGLRVGDPIEVKHWNSEPFTGCFGGLNEYGILVRQKKTSEGATNRREDIEYITLHVPFKTVRADGGQT